MEIEHVQATALVQKGGNREIESWLLSKRSENTRKAYARDLRQFVDFLEMAGATLEEATPDHVNAWARSQTQAGVAASTVNRRLATVSSFYSKLVAEGKLAANPAHSDRVARENHSAGKSAAALDTSEMRALINAAKDAGDRDHLLVSLLAHTGMRVSELCSADLADVRMEKGHCVLFITGKGNKTRKVAIPPSVCAMIDGDQENTEAPLVLANDGERLNRHQVIRILARLQRAAGIDTKITPHVLRATMVTEALDDGVPLWIVQDAAGHSDSRTTRAYQRRSAALEKSPTYALAARWA